MTTKKRRRKKEADRWPKVLAGVAVFLVVMTAAVFSIPKKYRIERNTEITAQEKTVFTYLGELKRWNDWLIWAEDPTLKVEISKPSYGVGATYKWYSERIGKGQVITTDFVMDQMTAFEVRPENGDKAHWKLIMSPDRHGVRVTWVAEGELPDNRFSRLMSYLVLTAMGRDMRKSLDRLKASAESADPLALTAPWHGSSKEQKVSPAPSRKSKKRSKASVE